MCKISPIQRFRVECIVLIESKVSSPFSSTFIYYKSRDYRTIRPLSPESTLDTFESRHFSEVGKEKTKNALKRNTLIDNTLKVGKEKKGVIDREKGGMP